MWTSDIGWRRSYIESPLRSIIFIFKVSSELKDISLSLYDSTFENIEFPFTGQRVENNSRNANLLIEVSASLNKS